MTAQITTTSSDVEFLTGVVRSDPTNSAAPMALADCLCECGLTPEEAAAEVSRAIAAGKADHAKFLQTCLVRTGVTGVGDTLVTLATKITRRRPRGSGGRVELARRLKDACQRRADRSWALACKGQRKPTTKQTAEMRAALEDCLTVQSRCKERLLSVPELFRCAAAAIANGTAAANGGTISCGSYGYQWTTSTVYAERMPNGMVRLTVSRTGTKKIEFPASWFRSLAAEMVG